MHKVCSCSFRDNKYNNEHWCTVQHFCRPCEVEFDFVLKFETLAEEEPTFKRVLELEEDLSRQQREAEGTTAKYRNQVWHWVNYCHTWAM